MKIINYEDFNYEPDKRLKLSMGGLWEKYEPELAFNYPVDDAEGINCPHLSEKYIVRVYRYDGSYYDTIYANCPRVVIATNEGGYNSTGVCLDCLIEQVNELKGGADKL